MTVTHMPEPGQQIEKSQTDVLIADIRGDGARQQIADALPAGVPVEKFVRATVTALRDDEADGGHLVKADRNTLFQALVKCAADGLVPDKREAALVVYGGKVQYLPMIGGVRKIVGEFGWLVKTHAIYANDDFDVDLGTDRVTHRPPRIGEDRGDLVGAYAIAYHRDGRQSITEVMDMNEIGRHRAVSKSKDKGPWVQWTPRMAEKTVGHRIAKKLPLDPVDRQRLSRVIDAVELGPEESAALMYGPEARASFGELPSAQIPSEASAYPTEDAPLPSGAGASAQETAAPAEEAAVSPLPLTDEEEMLALDAAGYVPPKHRYSAEGEEGPLTLAEIFALPDDTGKKYLAMLLRQLKEPEEYVAAVHAFCRSAMPDVYQASLNQKAA
jgi:recombination protein RecT